ncbi:hypothetical protein K491DRAFT_719745 [Lophiostoma macrostomum CBS 122681]|uniref:Fucose-specific lectin n=1 Tax=Lophiostoma macrostomum CBS 122681 TaxID=1314788 RepID=A0A6A6SY92_9PLEO|nr:hypothetical protein K491DRAFT_719745 [Lophiostoma macrostomum CBS 122681]
MARPMDPESEQKELAADQGIEVTPAQGLEVAYDTGLETTASDLYYDSKSPHPRRTFRRKWFCPWQWHWLALLIIGFALVLGTVLGTKLKHGDSDNAHSGSSQATPKSSSQTTAKSTATSSPLTPIATLSPLAAASWTVDADNYGVKVIYQDDTGQLQDSTYRSSTDSWTKISNFATAKKGSPLAMTQLNNSVGEAQPYALTTILTARTKDIEIELFYVNETGFISEWTWGIEAQVNGLGSMKSQNYQMSSGSRLSAYWPFIILTDEQGAFLGYKFTDSWNTWEIAAPDPRAYNGGSLSLVPTPMDGELAGVSVYYQSGTSLRITQVIPDSTEKTFDLSQDIPHGASMTAFAFNSSNSETTFTFTCALYQDSSSTILMVWQNSLSTTWMGPKTFDAFKGADNGTNIACSPVNSYSFGLINANTLVPRCYFQTGGLLREVEIRGDATDWSVVGNVPLD